MVQLDGVWPQNSPAGQKEGVSKTGLDLEVAFVALLFLITCIKLEKKKKQKKKRRKNRFIMKKRGKYLLIGCKRINKAVYHNIRGEEVFLWKVLWRR